MKILMVNRVLYPRSLNETVMLRLADALTALGHEVLWFAREDRRNLTLPGAYLQPAPDFQGVNRRVVQRWQRWDEAAQEGMRAFLATHQPDAALLFNLADSLTYSVMEPLLSQGIPCCQMDLDFERLCPCGTPLKEQGWWLLQAPWKKEQTMLPCEECLKKGLYRCVLRRCVKHSWRLSYAAAQRERYFRAHVAPALTAWIVPSLHRGRQLALCFPEADIHSADLPLPLDAFTPRATDRGGYFVFVGSLSTSKGIWQILDAMEEMAEKEMRVAFAGDGPEREALLEEVRRRKLEDRVIYAGILKMPLLSSLIAGCEALLVPAMCEEIGPVSMLEALAMGKPVIASSAGVLGERVLDGMNGKIIRAGNVQQLTVAMDEICAMGDEEYTAMCQRAAEDARDRYHPEAYARRILEILALIRSGQEETEEAAGQEEQERRKEKEEKPS